MMKFLRHLLSHIMFLILISGIVAIYYFRSQVMPGEYVEKINHYAEKVHPAVLAFKYARQQVLVSNAPEQQESSVIFEKLIEVVEEVANKEEVNGVKDELVSEVTVPDEPVEILIKEEVIAPVSIVSVVPDHAEAEPLLVDVPVADKVVVEPVNPDLVISEPVEKLEKTADKEKTNPAVEIAPAKEKEVIVTVQEAKDQSADVATADYKMMLQSARSLFQNRKFKESISKYKELIELESHEADFHGELGNVYYGAGNWSMAGKAYYEAAVRLMDKGDLSQVSYLQRVLQGLDKDRAYKLAQLMSAKNQAK